MINFIPIFPLGIVVFPAEDLNLHIFEPRYIQLITECYAEKKPFGIPVVLKSGLAEKGTLVEITEISEVHDDGKIDIKTKGIRIFDIIEIVKSLPDKFYSGAIVQYPPNNIRRQIKNLRFVVEGIKNLHTLLKVDKDFKKPDDELTSYDVAHHAGMSLEQEYEFLGLMREDQRLEYLKRHINNVMPVISEMESLKDRIRWNGHFKNLSSDFNL